LAFVDKNPPTIAPDTDILTICQTFLDQATRRLPVLHDDRLLGQISRRDVMRTVSELTREKRCGHSELLYLSAIMADRHAFAVRMG
jgi:predicted transcriptional regulator